MEYYGGKFYIAGGGNFYNGKAHEADFWCFDPSNNSWIDLTSDKMFDGTIIGGSAVYNDYLYYFHGWNLRKVDD